MDLWKEANERQRAFLEAGDANRLEMCRVRFEASRHNETDPHRTVALYARGRHLAEHLGEPWWAFLYQVWQCLATLQYAHDYTHGLDLAVACVLKARDAAYQDHPWRVAPVNCLLQCYVNIDPVGYATEIRQTLDFLQTIVPEYPYDDRLVMLGHRWAFLAAHEKWEEARAFALERLAIKAADTQRASHYYGLAPASFLCWLAAREGDWPTVAQYAGLLEQWATSYQSEEHRSEAAIWQALVARQAKDEATAQRRYRSGTARMARLSVKPHERYFDALAGYHEMGTSPRRALGVRERQLESLRGTGLFVHECLTHLKRCRLLAQLGALQDSHLAAARAAVSKMRRPEKYLAELQTLAS
jgi:hypothetical protein